MDWTRQVKIVLRLPRKRRDGAGAEADHMADGPDLGDAGDPDPAVEEDVPPGLEADDLGPGTNTARKPSVRGPGRRRREEEAAVEQDGQEVKEGREEVAAILNLGAAVGLGLGQGRRMIRRSQRKIKTEIRIGTRKGIRIRNIKRTGTKVIRRKKRKSLTGEVSLRRRTLRNEEDLAPVHILGKSGRLATRRNVPRVKRRRRIIVTASPAWTV
jgi:hypothetical protein